MTMYKLRLVLVELEIIDCAFTFLEKNKISGTLNNVWKCCLENSF